MTPIERMIEEIRSAVARCAASEIEVMEALCNESPCWEMRLDELLQEAEEEDP